MYKAAVKLKFSKIDQENLYYKVENWKSDNPEDQFYFRGYGEIKQIPDLVDNEANPDGHSDNIEDDPNVNFLTCKIYRFYFNMQHLNCILQNNVHKRFH